MKKEVLLLVAMFMVSGCLRQAVQEDNTRPNFLFIIYDDASWEHFGCYGDKAIKTPGIDKLAESGILFSNAYCAAPSCSLSRAGILTGQDIYRLEEGSVIWGFIRKKFKVFPKMLEEVGYSVGYTGKPYWPSYFDREGANTLPTGYSFNITKISNPLDGISQWGNYTANFNIFLNQVEKGQPFCFWVGIQEPQFNQVNTSILTGSRS